MREWHAEIDVTDDLATRLIRAQFPELGPARVRRLAAGWDNTVMLVNEELVFRFPHRARAVENLERELAALPRLPDLPLAIPRPAHVGRPGDGYPWPFFGAPRIPGQEVAEVVELSGSARSALGARLGTFLRALHAPEVVGAMPSSLPDDPMGRADMAIRVPAARERLAQAAAAGLWTAPSSVERLLEEARHLPRPGPSAVAHGDLHHRHLLVDDGGAATGVIDWGDVCRADPAVDLPLYWSLLDPPGRDAFRRAYGPIPGERLLRARVLAFMLCAVLAVYAHEEGLPGLVRESVAGLDRAVIDERASGGA